MARKKGSNRASGNTTATAPASASFDGAECRRVVDEFTRQRKNASEYAGSAGGVMKQGCERLGVDRRALNLAAMMDAKEPVKRTAFMRDFLRIAHSLGHFDQIDAFDDTLTILQEIVADVRGRTTPATPQENAESLDIVLN